jgi:hypothetical protein
LGYRPFGISRQSVDIHGRLIIERCIAMNVERVIYGHFHSLPTDGSDLVVLDLSLSAEVLPPGKPFLLYAKSGLRRLRPPVHGDVIVVPPGQKWATSDKRYQLKNQAVLILRQRDSDGFIYVGQACLCPFMHSDLSPQLRKRELDALNRYTESRVQRIAVY